MALPCSGGEAPHVDVEVERVARFDLAAEPHAVDPAEQRQLASEALVAQYRECADLRDRLAHQHTGKCGSTGEVAGEEPLVARQSPPAARRLAWNDFEDLVHEQKRWTVRQHVGGIHLATVEQPR